MKKQLSWTENLFFCNWSTTTLLISSNLSPEGGSKPFLLESWGKKSSSSTPFNVERVLFYIYNKIKRKLESLWKFNSAIDLSKCVHKLNFIQIHPGTDAADSQRLISNLLVTEDRRRRRHLQIPKSRKKLLISILAPIERWEVGHLIIGRGSPHQKDQYC